MNFPRRPFESSAAGKETDTYPARTASATLGPQPHSRSVTAPDEALLTCFAYFANAPRRA